LVEINNKIAYDKQKMKSQTVLISIFIFSFFALHQCM